MFGWIELSTYNRKMLDISVQQCTTGSFRYSVHGKSFRVISKRVCQIYRARKRWKYPYTGRHCEVILMANWYVSQAVEGILMYLLTTDYTKRVNYWVTGHEFPDSMSRRNIRQSKIGTRGYKMYKMTLYWD